MKRSLVILFSFILLLFRACSPAVKVTTDYDKNTRFTDYRTFSIYKAEKMNDAISQLNQQRILNAIRSEMMAKGFQETATSPDLLVNPVAILKDRVAVSSNTDVYSYGGLYRPYYWGAGAVYGSTTYNVQHYKDGSLIIDIVDTRSKALVWQGIGNSEIDGPIKDPDTKIPKAVKSIMADFPPGMAKK